MHAVEYLLANLFPLVENIYSCFLLIFLGHWGFLGGSDSKEPACTMGDPGCIPGLGEITWRREWLPTLIFLPGEMSVLIIQSSKDIFAKLYPVFL